MPPLTIGIHGVELRPLEVHGDDRGRFAELYRDEWFGDGLPLRQWNLIESVAGTMRGFHCHVRHTDWLVVLRGLVRYGLRDLRRGSPTFGTSAVVDAPPVVHGLRIPPGVGHGLYFPEDTVVVFGVSSTWALDDELGCHWADPGLGIDWGVDEVLLSDRDRTAGSLDRLVEDVERGMARVAAPAGS